VQIISALGFVVSVVCAGPIAGKPTPTGIAPAFRLVMLFVGGGWPAIGPLQVLEN